MNRRKPFLTPKLSAAGFVLIAATAIGCQSRTVHPTEVGPDASPSFAVDVAPVLRSNCSPCHIGLRTSGVELSSHVQTVTSVGTLYGEVIVVQGDADASPLVDKIARVVPEHGRRMPDGRAPLSASQIERIRSWIDDGALDN